MKASQYIFIIRSCGINKKGFTLVELMVVVAIIGILTAIAVPRMVDNAERARVATDLFNLHTLNSVTRICAINYGNGFYSWFSDISNEDRWKHLIEDQRVLHERIEPKRPGYDFFWSSEKNLWLYSDEEGNTFYFSFNGTGYSSIDEEGLASIFNPRYNNRGWEITAGGLRSTFTGNNENILYIDIGETIGREYVITVTAAMNDGPGYGILFDTTGEGNSENGYSLQYERSSDGRIILRPRINGRENPNIDDLGGPENWENHHIYQHLTEHERSRLVDGHRVSPILFNYSLNSAQKELLESGNDLKLKVRDAATGKRKVDVYLGNDKVIEGFEYNIADPGNPMTTSGYRVWFNNGHSGENVLFKSFDISNITE